MWFGMKKAVLKGIVFGLIFFVALIVISRIMNKGNADMTADMAVAEYPVVYMELDGVRYNELHGYAQAMNTPYMRDSITVLNEGRTMGFAIETYGNSVNGISYEVRSVDGERLIESTDVKDVTRNGNTLSGQITVKDLIDRNEEYELIFLLDTESGNNIRYYTRLVWPEDYHVPEKLGFAMTFSEKSFDKESVKDLAIYMEPNSEGDNSTLHYVNIHCSLNQVSWGNLAVEKVTEPVFALTELAEQTASLLGHYVVSVGTGDERRYFYVEEYYRIRYTEDRIYLLDYYRTMNTMLNEQDEIYVNDKILIGVEDENLPLVESEDGNVFAFEVQNRLFSYNVTTNKLAVIFGFYDSDNADARTIFDQHTIKVLNIDEAGNVQFVVYGYMNRGRHEGEVGVQLYNYDSTLNTLEEVLYIPYSKTYRILKAEMNRLLYLSRDYYLYLTLEGMVYEVDLTEKTCRSIVEAVEDESIQVSGSNKMVAWQRGGLYDSQGLVLMNLGTRERISIDADMDEYIMPLGFMEEDLVYGVARRTDITADNAGRITFPMYAVYIESAEGEVLKEYRQEGIYISGCTMQNNQITLSRLEKAADGTYEEISPDNIMNNSETVQGRNTVVTVVTENYGKYVQIEAKKTINAKSLQILTPKEVLYEGERNLDLSNEESGIRYYVYIPDGGLGIYSDPAMAVMRADTESGVVLNDAGDYVWVKGNLSYSNQISGIEEASVTEEKNSLAVCLDTMLKYEGVIRNSEYLLSTGETVSSILENNLEGAQVLDLQGCSLSAVLYYVNRDIPVLVSLHDGGALLIVGFNQYNVILMDPTRDAAKGIIYRLGLNDSRQWFEENGNSFITYVQ